MAAVVLSAAGCSRLSTRPDADRWTTGAADRGWALLAIKGGAPVQTHGLSAGDQAPDAFGSATLAASTLAGCLVLLC